MRFSLLALFASVTVVAAALALILQHGLFGILFLVPHVSIVVIAASMRKWKWAPSLCIVTYLLLWAATAVFGIPAVRKEAEASVLGLRSRFAMILGRYCD